MGQFDKFKKDTIAGAKKKEIFKQEKRRTKAETEAYFKEKRKESRPASGIVAGKLLDNQQKSGPAPATAPAYTRPAKVDSDMALNKYISHSGICSRREAAVRVKAGEVKVNDKVEMNPAYKVLEGDVVSFNGKKVTLQQRLVYILLNKPKDFITTADDDKGRKTVLDIVKNATDERIFPVGRLDRNTTGVLLLTNDGELTQQLTHPSFEVRKMYEVTLDKPVIKADLEKLLSGVVLEDGEVHADAAGYADPKDKSVVGVEIHSGKNRVVRRMFEHLGYDVRALDRVMFANLTKKNVDRGRWRFLSEKEVRLLKFFNKSKRKPREDDIELQDTPFSRKPEKKHDKPAGKRDFPAEKRSRPTDDRKTFSPEKRSRPTDTNDFSSEKRSRPTEDRKTFSPEKRSRPSDKKDFSSEKQRGPDDRKPYNKDKKSGPPEKWNFSGEKRTGPSDRKEFSSDSKRGPSDKKDFSSDKRGGPSDKRDYSSDRRGGSSDRKNYSTDKRSAPPEKRDSPYDKRSGPSDRKDFSNDRRSAPSDKRPDRRDPSPARKAPPAHKKESDAAFTNPEGKRIRKRIPRK